MARHSRPDPPTDATRLERARSLIDHGLWTIDMQITRLREPFDPDDPFVLRKAADFHFVILALWQTRVAAQIATSIPAVSARVQLALDAYDELLPHLEDWRNALMHIDDYALEKGRNPAIDRRGLQVHRGLGPEVFEWLGYTVRLDDLLPAARSIFDSVVAAQRDLHER